MRWILAALAASLLVACSTSAPRADGGGEASSAKKVPTCAQTPAPTGSRMARKGKCEPSSSQAGSPQAGQQ